MKMEILKKSESAGGKLTYQLIKTDEQGIPVYGIKIVSVLFGKTEEIFVSDVTCEPEKGAALFELCYGNTVLPDLLPDICADFILSEAIVA
jgi:hypothetical protein